MANSTETQFETISVRHQRQGSTCWLRWLVLLAILCVSQSAFSAFSLVITNGYGDVYRMNLLRNRDNYQAYRGSCSYRGFSLSGCSTTGEVVMLRIKATPAMPEYTSLLSTSMRWGTTMYVLNDLFRPLCSWVGAGYENWYPFDMSCSVAMYINSGGYGLCGGPSGKSATPLLPAFENTIPSDLRDMQKLLAESVTPIPTAFSLVMTNGYGDCYRMNLLRNRDNYQCYRGSCSYRGFSLSGCSTTGEVVMLRIKATPAMPEHFSLVSTSLRWGSTMYFLNDVFRPLNSTTMAGYENWYPFDMSCSVAMYINSGGLGLTAPLSSQIPLAKNAYLAPGGTNVIGALIPLTGELGDVGASYQAAYEIALAEITNTAGMPPIRLLVKDSQTDPLVAVEQLAAMYTQGVRVVLGPESSAECEGLLEYATSHGMLLLSSSSTAVPLAIPNDNLVRMSIDDSKQAKALVNNVIHDGITNLVILTRSDMYGEGLRTFLLQEFATNGCNVFFTGYCPRATGFLPDVVSNLNDIVAARAASVGVENIGMVLAVFDEGVQILQEAAAFPCLTAARWYGTDGMAGNASLLSNSNALSAARQTQFVCTAPDAYTNALYPIISDAIQAKTFIEPLPYALHGYDALWLAAMSLRDTGSTGAVQAIRAAIRSNATTYAGATGPIFFNSADDRSAGWYQCVRVTSSNEWVNIAQIGPETPTIHAPTNMAVNGFKAQWSSSAGALQYYFDVSSSIGFEPDHYVGNYSNLLLSAVSSRVVTGMSAGETYYYRVRAENMAGLSSNSAIMPTTLPTHAVITISANPGGRVQPSGPVNVYPPESSAQFTVTASNYYEIAEIHTNDGVVAGVAGMTGYTQQWDAVTADGQFYAVFRAKTATNAVPLWWLAQYYTVTTNGDALALRDDDADGLFTWQEYVAGTVPTNYASCLRCNLSNAVAGGPFVLRWHGELDRLYTLLCSSNVVTGWTNDPAFSDIPGTGNDLCYTSSLPRQVPCSYFRVNVRLNQ